MALTSCGKDEEAALPLAATKALFSSWAQQGGGMVLDLTGAVWGTGSISFTLSGGVVCGCTMFLGGSESAGNLNLTGCVMTVGAVDPGCNLFNSSNTYTNSAATLTICDSSGCTVFI